jgi:hypothetical protein
MNLNDFFNYKKECPVCNSCLSLSFFQSRRNHKIIFENEYVRIITETYSFFNYKNVVIHSIHYKINLYTNEFSILFANKSKYLYYDEVPITVLNAFKNFNANVGYLTIRKECLSCKNYIYNSTKAALNFKNSKIENISIDNEVLCLIKPLNNIYKSFLIHNYFCDNYCNVYVDLVNKDLGIKESYIAKNPIKIPIIDMSQSKEIILNRIDKLILFS